MTRAASATAITLIAILGLSLPAHAGGMFEEHEFFFGTTSQAKAPVNAHLVWYDLFGGTSEESASAKVDLDGTLLGWRGGSWSTKNPRLGIEIGTVHVDLTPEVSRNA